MNWPPTQPQDEVLSPETRSRILAAALAECGSQRPLVPLFAPVGRLVAAGTIPLVLAGILGLALVGPGGPTDRPFTVAAVKEGDQVVFTIANGGRDHRVMKSEAPDRFVSGAAVRVRGRYADRMEDDGPLVFYRIE